MTLLNNINHFITLFVQTLRMLGRIKILAIMLLYTLFLWLVLYVHNSFVDSPLQGLMLGWLNVLNAFPDFLYPSGAVDFFKHYPGHYIALPETFGWTKYFVALVLEGLLLGTVALWFGRAFAGQKSLPEERSPLSAWLQLIIYWLVLNIAFLAVYKLLPIPFEGMMYGKRLLLFKWVLLPGVLAVILGLFYYAVPGIMIRGYSAFRALGYSVRLALRRPFTAFFLAVLILAGPIIVANINDPTQVVEKFRPELVYWLLVAGLFVELFAYFFWMGTSTRYVLDVGEEPR